VDVCREHDLKQSEVEEWMDTFVKAGERGLKARAEAAQAAHEAQVRELRANIGERVLELDARKELAAGPTKAVSPACIAAESTGYRSRSHPRLSSVVDSRRAEGLSEMGGECRHNAPVVSRR
jgi:hypothetical protein